ncbi:glycosaminoglycan xylosylkinase-like isoform X6 [Scylla paramamosain]
MTVETGSQLKTEHQHHCVGRCKSMWWVQQALVWLVLGAAFTAALNFFLMSRGPPLATILSHLQSPPSSSSLEHHSLHQQVYLRGEVYALRNSEYLNWNQKNRTGITNAIHALYDHLPGVKVRHRTPSPHLHSLIHTLRQDITTRGVSSDPWDLAKKWANPRSLVPGSAHGLGDVLGALATAPIISSDVGHGGTQLKIFLLLKGGQRAVFKPIRYLREEIIEGEIYDGADRHNGEVAAFHLSRLLALPTVPLAVGRWVSLRKHILPVASKELATTFFKMEGGEVCFYGVCYYCNKNESVCDNGATLEGVVTMWLPPHLPLTQLHHPWARTYIRTKLAPLLMVLMEFLLFFSATVFAHSLPDHTFSALSINTYLCFLLEVCLYSACYKEW